MVNSPARRGPWLHFFIRFVVFMIVSDFGCGNLRLGGAFGVLERWCAGWNGGNLTLARNSGSKFFLAVVTTLGMVAPNAITKAGFVAGGTVGPTTRG
jgi:hypothetical protein